MFIKEIIINIHSFKLFLDSQYMILKKVWELFLNFL